MRHVSTENRMHITNEQDRNAKEHVCVCVCVCLSVHLSICLYVFIYLSICLSVYLSVCPSVCVSVCGVCHKMCQRTICVRVCLFHVQWTFFPSFLHQMDSNLARCITLFNVFNIFQAISSRFSSRYPSPRGRK